MRRCMSLARLSTAASLSKKNQAFLSPEGVSLDRATLHGAQPPLPRSTLFATVGQGVTR